MIDFHTHILPNIDDGARNIEETIELVEEARKAGFEAIISTSHYMEGYYETNAPEREMWINIIYQQIQEKNIKMQLYLGNEVYLSENIIELVKYEKASTINDTNYVLFEMPLNVEPLNLFDIVYEMKKKKIIPILAHPERYAFVQQDPEIINDLIEAGVLMQANYASIDGYYGGKAQVMVRKLLENDMIHLLGSDVHRPGTIYPRIPQIIKKLKEIIGRDKLEEITTLNPKLVLQNRRIELGEPNIIELTMKEKLVMKFSRS